MNPQSHPKVPPSYPSINDARLHGPPEEPKVLQWRSEQSILGAMLGFTPAFFLMKEMMFSFSLFAAGLIRILTCCCLDTGLLQRAEESTHPARLETNTRCSEDIISLLSMYLRGHSSLVKSDQHIGICISYMYNATKKNKKQKTPTWLTTTFHIAIKTCAP